MPKPLSTWFPFYVGDYMADTIGLTLAQHGAYTLALCAYWRRGGPLPDAEVRAIMGGEADVVLARFFTIDGGHWSQKRVEIELTAAAEHQRLQKLRTAAASAARRGRNDTDVQTVTDTVTDTVTSTSSPSPSPSQVQLPSSSREGSLKGTTALVPSAPSSTSEDSCQERSKQGNGGEPKTKAKTTKLRKPLNGEWIIEDGDARDLYAKKVGMTEHDIDVECDKFENFHRAKGTLFADAEAGWRTWCRNWQTYRERRI